MERVLRTEGRGVAGATAAAMNEVTSAVVAIVFVLCSVFIPVGFLGGLAGVMYRQFAVTIAIAVVIEHGKIGMASKNVARDMLSSYFDIKN